jgi:ABC-type polysaccharide/polyol phosphate transport system ATPase subunit
MKSEIEFSQVYKRYRKNMKSFKNIFGYLFNIPSNDDFWALANVSFRLKKGDILGIIGENGAGKSTILKILAKVTEPTKGGVKVDGRVGALIEIGAGLHSELTGSENIFLYGAILGMKRREVKDKFNKIVEFSGLKEFLNTPVKFYSSGMYLRLGFSVTVYTDPDILLIDEVLAVGDERFQRKCFEKIDEFRNSGKTIIFVSHNLIQVQNLCQQVLWLDGGRIKLLDDSKKVVNSYRKQLDSEEEKALKDLAPEEKTAQNVTGGVRIVETVTLNNRGRKKQLFKTGEEMIFRVTLKFYENVKNPIFGYIIFDDNGKEIFGTNTMWQGKRLGEFKKNSTIYFQSRQNINLLEGRYFFSVAVAHSDALRFYDRREKTASFGIAKSQQSTGVANLYPKISILKKLS